MFEKTLRRTLLGTIYTFWPEQKLLIERSYKKLKVIDICACDLPLSGLYDKERNDDCHRNRWQLSSARTRGSNLIDSSSLRIDFYRSEFFTHL